MRICESVIIYGQAMKFIRRFCQLYEIGRFKPFGRDLTDCVADSFLRLWRELIFLHPRTTEETQYVTCMAFNSIEETVSCIWSLCSFRSSDCFWVDPCFLNSFLFKSPSHTCKIPWILSMFPNAKFVFIHREPRATLWSSLKVGALRPLNLLYPGKYKLAFYFAQNWRKWTRLSSRVDL